MFDWIMTTISDFLDSSSHDTTLDIGCTSDACTPDNSPYHDTDEPSFQNAWGNGPEFIVPSEADSTYPMFDFTEITYGPGPGSDDFSHSTTDWDW